MAQIKKAILVSLGVILLTLTGCMENEGNTNNGIREYGTKQFSGFVKSAKISPADAYKIVENKIKSTPDGKFATRLYISVNNEYHFTAHANKVNYITLSGFYVDAMTGNIRFVQQEERYKLQHINHSQYFKPETN